MHLCAATIDSFFRHEDDGAIIHLLRIRLISAWRIIIVNVYKKRDHLISAMKSFLDPAPSQEVENQHGVCLGSHPKYEDYYLSHHPILHPCFIIVLPDQLFLPQNDSQPF